MSNTTQIEKLKRLANAMQHEVAAEIWLGGDVSIFVRKVISLEDFYTICGILAHTPFAVLENGESMYVPSAELTSFKLAVLRAFTDVELPENASEAYMLSCRLGLFEKVHSVLENTDMYHDLCVIADKWSKYHRASNTGIGTLEKAFANIDMSKEINKVFPGLLAVENKTAADA